MTIETLTDAERHYLGCWPQGAKALRIIDELNIELQKERDHRVEHRQQNQTLNEVVQRQTAEIERLRVVAPEIASAKAKVVAEFTSQIQLLKPGEVSYWLALKAAEQDVLDVMASIPDDDLQMHIDLCESDNSLLPAPYHAELKRRELNTARILGDHDH